MPQSQENLVKYWLDQLQLAHKRQEKWLKKAQETVKLYEAQRENTDFNILYSNTETLLPALYNAMPRPVIQRRYKDPDPISKAVCQTLVRSLDYINDPADQKYASMDTCLRQATLGALVPGMGVTWFRYDFEAVPFEQDAQIKEEREVESGIEKEGAQYTDGQALTEVQQEVEPQEQVAYETVCFENVAYDDFRWGFAKSWTQVPWVGRRHVMTKQDIKEQFGKEIVKKITFEDPKKEGGGEEPSKAGDANNEENKGSAKIAEVWEIWDKGTKKVYFVSEQCKEALLKEPADDPLGLTGFFPCPEPLQLTEKASSLIPTPLYSFYEEQAKELNRMTVRIRRVTNALKVRGFYNGALNDQLNKLLLKEDNELIPAPNASAFEAGGLDKLIWLMPLQELSVVLQNLLMARQQIKQTIYEITGISDILRGSSVASETATAQNIKNQWGTLRLKRMQKRVQVYARQCMRIEAELVGEKFSLETLKQITDLPFLMPEQKAMAAQQLQGIQQMISINPPQDPQQQQQIQQQVKQLQGIQQQVDWQQVVTVLRSDELRGYKIDIETNSTIDADATEDRQNINELLTGLAQTFQAFVPAVQSGLLPVTAFRAMMLAIARRYEFGSELEDELASMPDQLPQQPNPEMQKAQMEMQIMEKESQLDFQNKQEEQKTKRMEADLKRQSMQEKAAFDRQKLALDTRRMQRENEMAEREHERKMQEAVLQATLPPRQPANGSAKKSGQARTRQ